MLPEQWHMSGGTSRSALLRIALFLGVLAALGFIVGHNHGQGKAVNESQQTAISVPAKSQDRPELSAHADATTLSKATPADVTKLRGKEFIEALPSLEKLARSGNIDAVRTLYQQLGSCVSYKKRSDEEIRDSENKRYQQQLEITKEISATHPDRPANPLFAEDSLRAAHESALKAAFDLRDLCSVLTLQRIESRLDWLQLALERRDRQTILDATMQDKISIHGIERVRNAEKLLELAQSERSNLHDLIATGDLTALQRAAYAYGADFNGILPRDAETGYMYAYVLSLIGGEGNETQQGENARRMEKLASGLGPYPPLTAQQIEDARVRGLALFRQCCASSTHH
jgi:hypothetical protein